MSLKILNTFNGVGNDIAYVEFIQDSKVKILKVDNFIRRFGNTLISDFERGTSS